MFYLSQLIDGCYNFTHNISYQPVGYPQTSLAQLLSELNKWISFHSQGNLETN